jgi:hypothetical protein
LNEGRAINCAAKSPDKSTICGASDALLILLRLCIYRPSVQLRQKISRNVPQTWMLHNSPAAFF